MPQSGGLQGELGVALGYKVTSTTSITLVNATAKTQDITVPAGKRWQLLSMKMINPDDVARTCSCTLFTTSGKTVEVLKLMNGSVNAGARVQWPVFSANVASSHSFYPLVLVADETLSFVWASGGASTGATDADALVLQYLQVDN